MFVIGYGVGLVIRSGLQGEFHAKLSSYQGPDDKVESLIQNKSSINAGEATATAACKVFSLV